MTSSRRGRAGPFSRKLPAMLKQRVAMADLLTAEDRGHQRRPGAGQDPRLQPGLRRYSIRVDGNIIIKGPRPTRPQSAKAQRSAASSAPRATSRLALRVRGAARPVTFGKSRFPYDRGAAEGGARDRVRKGAPRARSRRRGVVVLPWNEKYTGEHVDFIAAAIRQAAQELS